MTATAVREEMLAQFARTGRNHPYLAFTINSICDRDCVFCKPRCVEDYGPKDRPLSSSDFAVIAAEAGRWAIRKAHLSGGEPTLRRDLPELIQALADGLGPQARIGITTHGNLRRSLTVDALRACGLTYLNVSLHSLDAARSAAIMGGGDPARAMDTVHQALTSGMQVKINCVVQRTYLADALDVVRLAERLPVAVRLIELQRIGPATALFPSEFVAEAEMREQLEAVFRDTLDVDRGALGVRSPGQYVRPSGWLGSIGFISNSSCATCSDANRIKITPTGIARPCVLHDRDIELREYLDAGTLADAFAHLFGSIRDRDSNPSWGGVHYIDYDLRWDRVARPKGVRILPLAPVARQVGAATPTRDAR